MAKELRITRNQIVVSANPHTETGMLAMHEMDGILPGCRKTVKLTDMPVANGFVVMPLFGHSSRADVSVTVWEDLVCSAEIVSDDLFPVELNAVTCVWARQQALRHVNCPRVRDLSEVAQSYLDSQRFDVVQFSWQQGVVSERY